MMKEKSMLVSRTHQNGGREGIITYDCPHLSSIQHKSLTPYMFTIVSFQMTHNILIQGL